ncbi:hypothetical protein DXX93_16725 [Thalassotalea euphylliae]|uniref:YncE family protein n=1 Tax=Thalassotalea euphylliae TaxID=1655234 RepID=A0A3E0TVV6_9GAMM|nr:YncE family protein [Thalassotalea euphylliae]REL28042.1 hypothetical protein DXX93_16725 [Thalassotalea euphylliae]
MSFQMAHQGVKHCHFWQLIWAVVLTCLTHLSLADEFANWESPHVHPIDRTPDGNTLLAVNTANHSLEVFDINNEELQHRVSIPVGLDPITVRARTNSEVWVVNHVSDSISVVDLSRASVVAVLATEDEPADVVFAENNGRAFVSCSQDNSVLVFDADSLAIPPTRIAINGEDPRSLSISPDGRTVYAAIFESGNASTILAGGRRSAQPGNVVDDPRGPYGGMNPPFNNGRSFTPAINPALPTPPSVGLIVQKNDQGRWLDDNNGDWTPFVSGQFADASWRVRGWDLPDRDVAIIDTQSLNVRYVHGVMNALMSSAVNPETGELTIIGTDATNVVRYEPNLNGHFVEVKLASIDSRGGVEVTDLNPHLRDGVITVPMAQRLTSIGDPRGLVWNQSGNLGYVVGMGSNNVLLVNAEGQRVNGVQPLTVGQGPTGIVLNENLNNAYVLNRFDGSISIIDTENFTELSQVRFFDPTPDVIKQGRPFPV